MEFDGHTSKELLDPISPAGVDLIFHYLTHGQGWLLFK